ncbi:hypothetical protein D6U55_19510, partial [Vibrio cholerae]|nr:hypothetical protein [Vibrio cholerae]
TRAAVDSGVTGSPARNISSASTVGYTLHGQFRTHTAYLGLSVTKIPDARLTRSPIGGALITNINVNGNVWTLAGH